MEIYLIERDFNKFKYLQLYFKDENVILVNESFEKFIKNTRVQCVVSPANSFGLMDGGYDLALTKWYGKELQERVQKYIIENYYGEQPVGSSFIIETRKDNQYLIHTPTMRTPEKIVDTRVIYQCMRTTLMVAKENDIKSVLIPMFGGLTGCVRPQVVAEMMYLGYRQIMGNHKEISWDIIEELKLKE